MRKLEDAKESFKIEDYEETEKLIEQMTKNMTDLEAEATIVRARYTALRDNTVDFVKENKGRIIAVVSLLILIIGVSWWRISIILTNKKIAKLKGEKKVLSDLMKKAQSDRYVKGTISKDTYKIKMNKYRERERKVVRELAVLRGRIKKK